MTSSLRNSLHRRNHKERSQLAHRAKYGVLEKHKDYVLRARDYHAKQDRIHRLKQKAANRNKDEFYFAMKKERTVEGVHVQHRGNTTMPMDMVKLLKSQDEGYIRTIKAVGLKKIDKIKRQLTDLADLVSGNAAEDSEDDLADAELETLRAAGVIARNRKQTRAPSKHIVFAGDAAEAQRYLEQNTVDKDANSAAPIGPGGSDLGWKTHDSVQLGRRRKKRSTAGDDPEEERDVVEVKSRKRLLKELAERLVRDTQLSYALRELEMQRLLVGKGGKKKVRGAELVKEDDRDSPEEEDYSPQKQKSDPSVYKPRVYKWRVERKR
ncbi:small-subunit processome [Boletus edulis BED1]|uniref:Small-subunit processome n=1 Tax=Boletus edulis BED1 TaxID=1328754 RepID=A0AAD4GIE4_BOLED|nr:small-subunit processome [Boletus edulis BED1]